MQQKDKSKYKLSDINMPEPLEEEQTEIIHEGSLMQQRDGKFAKRWVQLHKGKSTGYIYMKIYRHPGEGKSLSPFETPKSHFALTEDEFIGTVKGKINSSRDVFHYISVILQSEIIKFQEKSSHVCNNWYEVIRDNIEYVVLEVLTISGAGIKHSPKTLLHLTDNLLALSYSDVSKVFRTFKLKNIDDVVSSGCIVAFTANEDEKHPGRYELETMRESQAIRIVEEIQVRHRKLQTSIIGRPTIGIKPGKHRHRKESFQELPSIYVAFASSLESFKNERPILTPPSSPGSTSPTDLSPCVSPAGSPIARRHSNVDLPALPFNAIQRDNRSHSLQVPSSKTRLSRKNAIRGRRNSHEERIRERRDLPPTVPEIPEWTATEEEQDLVIHNVGVQRPTSPRQMETTSVECARCVRKCTCVSTKGPVLPKMMKPSMSPRTSRPNDFFIYDVPYTSSSPELERRNKGFNEDSVFNTESPKPAPRRKSTAFDNENTVKPDLPTRSHSVFQMKGNLNDNRNTAKPMPARRSGVVTCQVQSPGRMPYYRESIHDESATKVGCVVCGDEICSCGEGSSRVSSSAKEEEEDPYMPMYGWVGPRALPTNEGEEPIIDDTNTERAVSKRDPIPADKKTKIRSVSTSDTPVTMREDPRIGQQQRNDPNSSNGRLMRKLFSQSTDDMHRVSVKMDANDRRDVKSHNSCHLDDNHRPYVHSNNRKKMKNGRHISNVPENPDDSDNKTI